MSITRLGLPVSTHQVPNMKCSSSAYSKFVTASSVCSAKRVEHEDVEKTWATFLWKPQQTAQMAEHLACNRRVVGSNPGSCWHFLFLLSTFKTAVTRHPNYLWRQDSSEIKCLSSGNLNIVVIYQYLLLSVLYSPLEGTGIEMTYWKLSNIPVKATDKQLPLPQAIDCIPTPA